MHNKDSIYHAAVNEGSSYAGDTISRQRLLVL
jgi:hypothetical protein